MATNPFVLPTHDTYGEIDPYQVYGYQNYGGFAPYGPGTYTSSQNFGTALGNAGQDVDPNAPMEDIFAANRNQISQTGNLIGQEAGSQLNYYGPLQQQYTAAENQSLNDLAQTPGYTPEEAGQINVDYSQFNTSPDQYAKMAGDPNAPVQALQQGQAGQGAMLNQYQSMVGGQLGAYQSNLGSAVDQYGSNVGSAVGGLQGGLDAAQGKFAGLDKAVSNPALGFDPNSTEKQLTDQDVSDLTTQAGTTVGNQFQSQKDAIERAAAAQGNTSPAALAAIERDMNNQEAATAGDAMTNARIAALQAQYQRAAGIEAQREGAVQNQAGLQATAATTEEAAAQAAAGLGGQAGISAAQNVGAQRIGAANDLGQANLNAVTNYGQFSTNTAGQMANEMYGAQANAEQQAAQRAQNIGQMQYGEGTGSAQMTSQGAQTVGNARQAGQQAYRSGVAGQQGMAQQGGQAAVQAQLGAYGTQTSGNTQNAASQGSFEVGKPSAGDTASKGFINAAASLFAKGGIVTEPTIAKVGENGPEMIVPLNPSRYKSSRYASDDMDPKQFGRAA